MRKGSTVKLKIMSIPISGDNILLIKTSRHGDNKEILVKVFDNELIKILKDLVVEDQVKLFGHYRSPSIFIPSYLEC